MRWSIIPAVRSVGIVSPVGTFVRRSGDSVYIATMHDPSAMWRLPPMRGLAVSDGPRGQTAKGAAIGVPDTAAGYGDRRIDVPAFRVVF